jgi:hypothetical protein
LKPVIAAVSQRSITSRLAHFLDSLLQSVFQIQAEPTNMSDGANFIRKFNHYIEEKPHRLQSNTLLVTIQIPNFHTLAPHGTMLIVLKDFLNQSLALPNIGNLSVHRIIRLTALYLHNNRFYYDHKIYRFLKGGPAALPFTETLSNIYVYQWERALVREVSIRNQFYGR